MKWTILKDELRNIRYDLQFKLESIRLRVRPTYHRSFDAAIAHECEYCGLWTRKQYAVKTRLAIPLTINACNDGCAEIVFRQRIKKYRKLCRLVPFLR